jgi:hypothetical protein
MSSVLSSSCRFFLQRPSWRQGKVGVDLGLSRESSGVPRHGEVEVFVLGSMVNRKQPGEEEANWRRHLGETLGFQGGSEAGFKGEGREQICGGGAV